MVLDFLFTTVQQMQMVDTKHRFVFLIYHDDQFPLEVYSSLN